MNHFQKLQDFLQQHSIFLQDRSVLVACSGGVDSMVLLDLLINLNSKVKDITFEIAVAHCNFKLREDADGDEAFVKSYCQNHKIAFHSIQFDTKKEAEKEQQSIQITARRLRYRFFKDLQQTHAYDFVATAHHLSDSVETALYNFTKGTGTAGLRGILPSRNTLIRPLLAFTKMQILDYAQQNQLTWREDYTNKEDKYRRNFIRHHIIPSLKEINPTLETTFQHTAERLREVEKLLQQESVNFENQSVKYLNNQVLIQLDYLKKAASPLLLLSEFLKKYDFTYNQVQQIVPQLHAQEPKSFYNHTYILLTTQQEWILRKTNHINEKQIVFEEIPIQKIDSELIIDKLTLKKIEGSAVDFTSSYQYVDMDKINFPLVLRKWQNGDRFQPLGMKKGSKTIGDFLTDKKISFDDRSQVIVLTHANTIYWIGILEKEGLQISEKVKIDSNTKNVLALNLNS